MAKVLAGGAVGPDGAHVAAGEPPADGWPQWFLDDLEAHGALVAAPDAKPAGGKRVALEGTSSRRKGTR